MGNLLCVPRSSKKGDGKVTNKKSRWFTRQTKKPTDTDEGPDSVTDSASINEGETIPHDKDQVEQGITYVIPIVSPINCRVDPVVSSCILLKHFDDDDDYNDDQDSETELTETRDGTSPDHKQSEDGPERCEGSSHENGDAEKPADHRAKSLAFTETTCPPDTESSSEDTLKPSAEIELSDEVATSLKEVGVSAEEVSTQEEKTNKGETLLADVKQSGVTNTGSFGETMPEEPSPVDDMTTADASETEIYSPADKQSLAEVINSAEKISFVKPEKPNSSSGDVTSKVKSDDAKKEYAHPSTIQKLDMSVKSTKENKCPKPNGIISTKENMAMKGATQETTAFNEDSENDLPARLEREYLTGGVEVSSVYVKNTAPSVSSVSEPSDLNDPSNEISVQTEMPLTRRHCDIKAIMGKQLQIEIDAVVSKPADRNTCIHKEIINVAELLNKNTCLTSLRGDEHADGNTSDVDNKLTANDVKGISKDEGISKYVTSRIIEVKPIQHDSVDGKVSLNNATYIAVAFKDKNKSKLVTNEIDSTDDKVDECKHHLAKCTATVCKTIPSSADTMVSIDGDRGIRETTETSNATKLINNDSDNVQRPLESQTQSYHGGKASLVVIGKKDIHNNDMLDDTERKEDCNKTKYSELKAASSCPTMPKKSEASTRMKDLAKMLEALSVFKVPVRSDQQKMTKFSKVFSRNVMSQHQCTSTSSGFTDTRQAVQSQAMTGRVSSLQHSPSPGTSIIDSNTLVKSTGMSPGVPSTQQLTSNKKEKSTEFNKSVILTQATTATTPADCEEPNTSTGLSGKLILAQSGNSESSGYYESSPGIQKWLQHSVSEPLPSVTIDATISGGVKTIQRKVSDFEIPKKKPRPPQKPLVLKTPSAHLFGLPGIAKSDLIEDKDVKWTQKDLAGPQTEVLWSSKPTSYDVKFPPLPKRLLEREGSIDKLRSSWVIPQAKQIETLKREFGRFPGFRVPTTLRNKYSVEIKDPNTDVNGVEDSAEEAEADYDN